MESTMDISFENNNRDQESGRGEFDGVIGQRRRDRLDNPASSVFIPRLNLNLSEDDIEFDNLNNLSSTRDPTQLHPLNNINEGHQTNLSLFNNVKRQQNYAFREEDVISKLEKSLSAAKKNTQKDENQDKNDGIIVITGWTKRDIKITLLNHLKFLHASSAVESSMKAGGEVSNTEEVGDYEPKWWQRKPKVTRKELLKISVHSLKRYYELFIAKLEEISIISGNLFTEKERNKVLRKNVTRSEKKIQELVRVIENASQEKEELHIWLRNETEDIKRSYEEEKTIYLQKVEMASSVLDSERMKWKAEIKMLKNSKDDMRKQMEAERDCLEKSQAADKEQRNLEIKKLKEDKIVIEETFKEKLKQVKSELDVTVAEKQQIKREHNILLQKYREEKANQDKEKEIERLKFQLKQKQSENEELSVRLADFKQEFKSMQGTNDIIVRDLREELLLKEQQLNEIKDRFGNQFLIARLQQEMCCDEDLLSNIDKEKHGNTESSENKSNEDCEKDLNEDYLKESASEKDIESASYAKHEHFMGGLSPGKLETGSSKEKDESMKTFAVLKIEDIWQEQIACHESNVVKLKELQNLRKNLIRSREDLEKSMRENAKLKESIRSRNDQMEKRIKVLSKMQTSEIEKKEVEIENLKIELMKKKNETRKLSKEVEKNVIVQQFKDEEIELLNATVKAENNDEYCIITMNSMVSFKQHMEKLRHENNNLLNYCDRVEEKYSEIKRELALTRKLANELSNRESNLQKRCKELVSELDNKDSQLKKQKENVRLLKENFRNLNQRYDDVTEEAKDERSKIVTFNAKVARMQKKVYAVENEKGLLQQENSNLSKSLAETARDLQKSIDLVCQLKIRYENVEERFKEEEDKIKELNDVVLGKEKEIRDLYDEIRNKQSENDRVERQLEEAKRENNRSKEDVETLRSKIEEILNEAEKERFGNEDKSREIQRLKKDVKELHEKIEECEDVDKISNDLKILQNKVSVLEEDNRELEREKMKLMNEHKAFEEEIDKLKSRNAAVNDENSKLFEELKEQEKAVADKEKVINELESKIKTSSSPERRQTEENQGNGSKMFGTSTARHDSTGTYSSATQSTRKEKGKKPFDSCETDWEDDVKTSKTNKRKEDNLFLEDDVFDFEKKTSSCSGQEQNTNKANNQQQPKKPMWLFGDTTKSKAPTSSNRNPKDESIFEDSLDDFFSKNTKSHGSAKENSATNSISRGRRSTGNDTSLFGMEQMTDIDFDGNSNRGQYNTPVMSAGNRSRRRGQNGQDAADELKKLVEF